MLSEKEKAFVEYWEKSREREKKLVWQLLIGIPAGLLFAVPILLFMFTGQFWYKRAIAVANTQLNPAVMIIAVILITLFIAIFHKRHQWELKEQLYRELLQKLSNTNTETSKSSDQSNLDV